MAFAQVVNRERSQETITGEHFASNCYSECETSKVYNYSIHRRLQRLDTFSEPIFNRSRWLEASSISEISKFNYLLELTKGKPREDILGLPHTSGGYIEAKRILLETYGKDIMIHKAIIQAIESLQPITDIHKTTSIHEFYNKLSRAVRTLTTMKKLDSAQSTVNTVMNKLGPVREILAMADDKWEEWKLE